MKTHLPALLTHVRIIATTGLLCLLTACSEPPQEYGVRVLTPTPASTVTMPLVINGKYSQANTAISTVSVELLRYNDNLSWTGAAWGTSTLLTTTLNTSAKTWACDATLPSGADLPDGWYLITARADYANGNSATENTVFSVGVVAPPVAPALYGWGHNTSGQLGSGAFVSANHPVPVFMRGALDGKLIAAVAGGYIHTLALTTEGRVYAWGSNAQRQLGLDVTTQPSGMDFPTAVNTSGVMAGKKIISIAAGLDHSLAADDAGRVFSWGDNLLGELGIGSSGSPNPVPQQVGGLLAGKKVIQVAAGHSNSYALTDLGEVFAWGGGLEGDLGDGTFTNRTSPVAVTGLSGVFISSLSVREHHVLALSSTGQVYAWGDNQAFQLGNNNADTSGNGIDSNVPVLVGGVLTGKVVTAVAAGRSHSFALAGGKVYAWGGNLTGQIGNGAGGSGNDVTLPLELAGNLAGKTITHICAGDEFSLASTKDNEVFVWGSNASDELAGVGGVNQVLPTQADFTSVLDGGRSIMALAVGGRHGMVLTGFPITPKPEIEIEAQGIELTDGGTLNFGNVGQGSSNPVFVTLRNRGTSDLKVDAVTFSGSGFYGLLTQPTIAPNGETGFYVFFQPNSAGAASGTLQITSNDADESPFDITLSGSAYPVGQVDTAFDPGVTGDVQAISVQPDGKVIVGGSFVQVAGPTARNRCARLDGVTGAADGFDPNLDSFVNCSAVLPDGKVMIGGFFTSVGGVARNKLARLNADGTLDTTYNAQLTGSFGVRGMALQSDGKLIIVGNITSVAGVGVTFIARLNPDGTRDASFAPTPNAPPIGVAVRGDGQVLIWGQFTTVNGLPRSRIAMLNGVDGSTDTSFADPIITVSSSQLDAAALQRDTKILVGGNVNTVNGVTRKGMCRLNPDGTLDTSFHPDINGTVYSIAVQADGGIIIGGNFTTVGGQPRSRVAKLKSNGSLDQYFNPGSSDLVKAVALQADGNVLLTSFGQIAGQSRGFLARVNNDLATQSLGITNGGATIEWLRGGSAPETNLVTFDVSTDGGTNWTPVGAASRVTFPQPGWTLTDGALPPTGHIRARAYPQGSQTNGSFGLVETIVAYGTPPDISVMENSAMVPHGATRQFGVVATGTGTSVMQLTIQNTGGTELTGISGVTLDDDLSVVGEHQSQFQLIRPGANSLAPGASATMAVIYKPKTSGRHAAILRIPTNDADTNPFALFLTGQGSLPFTTYKQQKSGDSASPDTADTDGNGQSELQEYATGTTTTSTDGDGTSISPPSGGGGFAPPSIIGDDAPPPPTGGTFLFNYRRNKLSLADVLFQVEWSETLVPNDWHTDGVTEEIISDDDSIQQIQATVPSGTSGHRFVRLRITRP